MASNARPPERAAIAVFAKAPRPGHVKTRLTPAMSPGEAAALHESLVERALGTAVASALGPVELWCAPDAGHPFFPRCARRFGARLHVQQGQDLGARMAHAFEASHRAGRALVLIGSDCPALEPADLRDAAAALASHDAVFAPAEDGGYVLVALRAPAPALFEGIAWGGADVMQRTRERAAAAHLRLKELRTLWDVDRPEDWRRLEREGPR
jgi:rSAM/selenodomain-associated transferase 1